MWLWLTITTPLLESPLITKRKFLFMIMQINVMLIISNLYFCDDMQSNCADSFNICFDKSVLKRPWAI